MLVLSALLLLLPFPAKALVFIVNPANNTTEITRLQIVDFFLKRRITWANGEKVKFIDRTSGSEVRNQFLKKYVRKTSREIETFWIGEKLYSGNSAPSEVKDDTMVIALVSKFPGAIGYLLEPPSNEKVKIIQVKEE